MSEILRLEGVTKDFGEGLVLHGLDLSVEAGEFLTLLGPSGCGKTTTLRIIAGLEQPTSGRVWIDGRDVTDLPPERRDVNTVFQSYALFPHMNVEQNIAYGLKLRHVPKPEQKRLVASVLRLVQLSEYGKRSPTQLSGGQRQRVAIARALVLSPKVLLLDEPLGALDLQLRRQMQDELKTLQRESGVTFVYITHDQEEALNMSTRIVILNGGRVEQIGTPGEIYEHPETLFAAGFIGQSNLLHGVVSAADGENVTLNVGGLPIPAIARQPFAIGDRAVLCLRPQRIRFAVGGEGLRGVVESKEYSGGLQHTRIRLTDALTVKATSQTDEMDAIPVGAEVRVAWDARRAPIVHDEDGVRA